MKSSHIVSAIGPDRPGLVEKLSRVITEAGGNWEGSRLMQLGGQFAGMVQVVVADSDLSELKNQLARLEHDGLTVSIIHSEGSPAEQPRASRILSLEVVGQDRSGIVAAISQALAGVGANVIELATDCREAAWSGERHFFTTASIAVPEDMDPDILRSTLERLAGDLMVEIRSEAA